MSFARPPYGRPRPRWVAMGLGAVLLGCAGLPTGGATPNREACERYADHLNGLFGCAGLVYDSANLCEGADEVPADLVPVYACLTEHTRCEGPSVVLEGERCVLPLVALDTPPVDPEQEAAR